MDYRGVLLIGMLGGAALVGATSACSGADPGQVTFSERLRGSSPDLASGGTTSGQPAEGGVDGGGADAGADAPVTITDPFGATTFTLGALGPGTAKGNMNHAAFPQSNPAGQECMACHAGTWQFAGTVFTDKLSTTPVAGAEIRVTKGDGTSSLSAFTDADGNFWVSAVAAPIAEGSRVGVRNGTLKQVMGSSIGAGGAACGKADCHGGAQGKVYLK